MYSEYEKKIRLISQKEKEEFARNSKEIGDILKERKKLKEEKERLRLIALKLSHDREKLEKDMMIINGHSRMMSELDIDEILKSTKTISEISDI
jgi:phage host-nuclease inhibitor protein Gam